MYFLIFLNFFDPLCKNWPLPHNRTLLENQIFQKTRFFSKIFDPLILEETVYVTLFLSETWWPKNPAVWLGKTHNWPHLNKISSFKMLPFFDNYLHTKNQRYLLIHSSHIVDQRVLQCDWKRSTPAHIQS